MRPPAWIPALPRSLDQLGLPVMLIMDLAVRQISLRGVCTIHLLSNLMKLPLELAETVFRRLSEQHYLEIENRKPAIARADLERAVAGYFVSEHSHAA